MKFFNHTIIIIALVATCIGCSQTSETSQLCDQAESVMEEHPDSALLLLKDFRQKADASKADRARFYLLLSQAYHKNFIDLKDDSLIRIASEYFSNEGDSYYKMLSMYIHGYVMFNAGRHKESMDYMLQTLKIATRMNDTLYMARAHELIGYNHKFMISDSEAITHHMKAASLYHKLGRRDNELDEWKELASAYSSVRRNEEAEKILDSISGLLTDEERESILY